MGKRWHIDLVELFFLDFVCCVWRNKLHKHSRWLLVCVTVGWDNSRRFLVEFLRFYLTLEQAKMGTKMGTKSIFSSAVLCPPPQAYIIGGYVGILNCK